MNHDTEEDAMCAYIKANPLDEAGVRAFADWLLERGRVDDYEILRFWHYRYMERHSKRCPTTYPPYQFAEDFRDYINGIDTWRGEIA